jgi:hypothetical protein
MKFYKAYNYLWKLFISTPILLLIWIIPCFFTIYLLVTVALCYKLPEKDFFNSLGNNLIFGIFVLLIFTGDYHLLKSILL